MTLSAMRGESRGGTNRAHKNNRKIRIYRRRACWRMHLECSRERRLQVSAARWSYGELSPGSISKKSKRSAHRNGVKQLHCHPFSPIIPHSLLQPRAPPVLTTTRFLLQQSSLFKFDIMFSYRILRIRPCLEDGLLALLTAHIEFRGDFRIRDFL